MLTSLSLIFLLGLTLGSIFSKLKLPSLLGMLITGMILSPYALNLLDNSILIISGDLRHLALVIILTRAGLSLDMKDLKKVGRPAIMMCFIPASLEILGVVLIAPTILDITMLEAAIMGSVIAAVSPAVVVPRMLKLMEQGYGTKKSIPQLILAGASVDDVFVIVLFTSFITLASGGEISINNFLQIPLSIIMGLLLGLLTGIVIANFFTRVHVRDTTKVLIILSISFLFLELERHLARIIPLSGLLAIMCMGVTLFQFQDTLAQRLSRKFSKLWVAAELILFVLVGATVDLQYAMNVGIKAIIIVIAALMFRMFGVFLSLLGTELTLKEKFFCMIAYTPKATVQAAIGAIPLTLGLNCGPIVLAVAVLSILITAPFGAIGVDKTYRILLKKTYP